MADLSASAKKVQEALSRAGLGFRVREMPDTTRTAKDAATAIGCEVGQIAKSLIFRTRDTSRPVLVIASGPNRVNEAAIGKVIGEPLEKADADFVRQKTGFSIGGVPPVGHQIAETFIDEDLWNYGQIWAAAGTPFAVFPLSPDDLLRITGGKRIAVT
jgi:prolyl-tRNA editing enzyme YbaK/EbsC (Cys-tRNA(Pro) deacylase)